MKLLCRLIILTALFLLLGGISYAQQKKDSTWVGQVRGLVRDSAQKYNLPLSTVAIYKVKDSSLVSYQLTNNFGEFIFREIPVGIPLKAIVSYTGYKTIVRKFIVPGKGNSIDLKEIDLERSITELKEVVVKYIPPVRMNGDTLEFNADAFDLDKNAVAEDLLRKLPRVTLWGDGAITINGKQVKQVLVNGKPFFGGDTHIATQNIPKDAIDKIQVYREQKDKSKPLDSTTDINIKLKKGKDVGYFGKIATGYGTDRRYEADANMNFFNSTTQFGIVGASNNINKIANDAGTLMKNSTYKGIGASIDYQPNFSLPGTNQPNSGGLVFQHDFIPGSDYNNTSRLTANYFIKNNTNTIDNRSKTITTLRADSSQTQQSNNLNKTINTGQTLQAGYLKRKSDFQLNASAILNTTNSNETSNSQTSLYDAAGILQSTNNATNENRADNKNVMIGVELNKDKINAGRLPGNWNIKYSFNAGDNHSDQMNVTSFASIHDPSQNQKFDRRYNNNGNNTGQNLSARLGDLSGLIFGNQGFIGIDIQNNLIVNTNRQDDLVKNRDTTTGAYVTDRYLTNISKVTVINEAPALVFTKILYRRELRDRYTKNLSFDITAQEQLYDQKNVSDHAFQNFTSTYHKFVPGASLKYLNEDYGSFYNNYSLAFTTTASYPTVDQRRPIVDSANLYNIQLGNPNLRESTNRGLSFKMEHISERTKNTFTYNFNVTGGIISHSFADSSITDNLGRSTHYTVNAGDSKYLTFIVEVNKAFKFSDHQLQIQFLPTANFYRNPSYINNLKNVSDVFSSTNTLNIYYTLKDWWAINLKESVSLYSSKQSGANNNQFKNSMEATMLSTSMNFTKRLSVGSNITYSRATSTGSSSTSFTIWNANTTYRLLPGNNLELKLAALDLLHQNTSIINTGSNNMLTRGITNVLQQYFMFTVAYYPRQFGNKAKIEAKEN